VGEEDEMKGRVEIFYNDMWGTLCGTGADHNVATVLCRGIGYSG